MQLHNVCPNQRAIHCLQYVKAYKVRSVDLLWWMTSAHKLYRSRLQAEDREHII
jgi:hypothetical protein